MYGSCGRIGLLVPSVNTVVEPETNRMAPEGINVYATRMRNARCEVEDTKSMVAHADRGADELASAHVDVIAFACTAGSFIEGPAWERNLKKDLGRAAGGIPVVTTSGAVVSALEQFRVKKLVVATPYPDEVNERERTFLEACGFEVLKIQGMSIWDAFSIGKVDPEETYQFATQVFKSDAEGLFISCTNFRTIEVIERLEETLDVPVVSSNQATFWASLRAMGWEKPMEGYGKLLMDTSTD